MLREELHEGVRRVLSILEEAGVASTIEAKFRRNQTQSSSPADILATYNKLSRWWDFASEGERRLVHIFQLEMMFDAEFWSRMLSPEPEGPFVPGMEIMSRIVFLRRELPLVLELLSTNAIKIKQEIIADGSQLGEAQEVLELRIIEQDHERSRPHRIIGAIESITMLYEVAAELDNVSSNTLSIIGCDSGSDKEFDFLGLAKALRAVKETILALWDRVVFFRERKMHAGFELLSESLPLIERIDQMNGNALSPEQCELMKRKVLGGVQRFLDAGCTIPEINKATQFSPRTLLAPSPKLLAPPLGQAKPIVVESQNEVRQDGPSSEAVTDMLSGLTPEQVRAIEAIIRTQERSVASDAEIEAGQESNASTSEADVENQ